MDPSHLWMLLISLFNAIKVVLDIRKTSLDATDAATEMFNSGKKLLHIDVPDEDDKELVHYQAAFCAMAVSSGVLVVRRVGRAWVGGATRWGSWEQP